MAGGRCSRRWRWRPITSPSSRSRSRRCGCSRRCAGCGRVLWAIGGVALAGLALAPIALHQAQGKNNDWIASFGMAGRLRETGISFFVGEAGLLKHALVPMALFAAAVALLLLRGGAREKRGAALALAVGGGEHPGRPRLRRRGTGLRPRAQPAAGADPADPGRRGRDRGAARRPAGDRRRRRPGRLPPRLLRLRGLPPRPPARRLADGGEGDRPAAGPAGDPRLGAGRRAARLLHRRGGDPRQVEAVAPRADPGQRGRRGQRSPTLTREPVPPCRPRSGRCSASPWAG